MKTTTYLSLGSNVGDRLAYLRIAQEKLANHPELKIITVSKVYETEPWPSEKEAGPRWFLNQVIKIKTSLNPQELLSLCQLTEKAMGRERTDPYAPRVIDIDILLYGNEVIDLPNFTLPHPHLFERRFVLIPLLEINPDLKDPVSGRPLKIFLTKLKDAHKVVPFL